MASSSFSHKPWNFNVLSALLRQVKNHLHTTGAPETAPKNKKNRSQPDSGKSRHRLYTFLNLHLGAGELKHSLCLLSRLCHSYLCRLRPLHLQPCSLPFLIRPCPRPLLFQLFRMLSIVAFLITSPCSRLQWQIHRDYSFHVG